MKSILSPYRSLLAIVLALLGGLGFSLSAVTGITLAKHAAAPAAEPHKLPPAKPGAVITSTAALTTDFSFVRNISYARIIAKSAVNVYSHPLDLAHGLPPTRTIEPGFMFVSLEQKEPVDFGNGPWYQINPNEYVPADVITHYTPSAFHGASLPAQPDQPFGWIIRDTPVFSAPVDAPTPRDLLGWPLAYKMAAPGQSFIPRYTRVTIYETSHAGDWGWRRIGPGQWVHLYDVGRVDILPRPAEIPAGERWLVINLFEQTMAVYDERDQMVYATLISSGRQVDGWRTPTGVFRIHTKKPVGPMYGGGKSDRYLLEDVTANMFFHQGYALHAAYWHDDFGRYKSHGCINMSLADAEWLYNWTTPVASSPSESTRASADNPGTWVWIYDPHSPSE